MSWLRTHVLVTLAALLCGCPFLEEEVGDGAWHECRPDNFGMQSGEPCDFSGGCVVIWDTNPEAELLSRYVDCINGVLSVTEALRIDEDPPSEDALWYDCDALEGGRSGDPCAGSFTCFKPDPSGCLIAIGCGAQYEPEMLVRFLLCDDANPEAYSAETTHSNCDSAADARPLDDCDSGFMCQGPKSPTTIPPCEEQGGYCLSETIIDGLSLIWCDRGTLHVLFADHYVLPAVLNWLD